MDMLKANDPARTSWINVPEGSDFPIQNLPFGVISVGGNDHLATRIGDQAIDLYVLAEAGILNDAAYDAELLNAPLWNGFIALGRPAWRALRDRLSDLFESGNAELRDNSELRDRAILAADSVANRLPIHVGDYTDFYSSIEHATNVGIMFRGKENALMPNWKHIPVGYHGRASSIVVSGTPIRRPKGQMLPADADAPVFGPSRLLDMELEVAFVTGGPTELGTSIGVNDAEAHIFGLLLFNDWSARDIQKWEYVPLGPFLGKNFGSSASPWIVSLDALEPFRVSGPQQDPAPLPYLQQEGDHNFDIQLEVHLQPESGEGMRICRSNFKYMYWSMAQQLAHHTVNGCNINPGDMCASGTISGPTEDSYGSMLELTWRGTKPISLPDGSERKFFADGDTVTMRGWGEKDGIRIGFGEVSGKILPAN